MSVLSLLLLIGITCLQADFIKRIEDLNQELKDAWDAEGRVKSLKIVIQV